MSKNSLTILSDSQESSSLCCELVDSNDLTDFAPPQAELAIIPSDASSTRRTQFILGRLAGHRALTKLNAPPDCLILKGVGGEPVWPIGFVGSISHTDNAALAVAGTQEEFLSLGADLERLDRTFDAKITSRIAMPAETKWIQQIKSEQKIRTLQLFSAKESLFKALFPLTQKRFGFKDAFLRWDDEAQSFIATLLSDLSDEHKAGDLFLIQLVMQSPYLMTCAIIPQE